MTLGMEGNRHFTEAKDRCYTDPERAQVLATLAVAEELRTANMIANLRLALESQEIQLAYDGVVLGDDTGSAFWEISQRMGAVKPISGRTRE